MSELFIRRSASEQALCDGRRRAASSVAYGPGWRAPAGGWRVAGGRRGGWLAAWGGGPQLEARGERMTRRYASTRRGRRDAAVVGDPPLNSAESAGHLRAATGAAARPDIWAVPGASRELTRRRMSGGVTLAAGLSLSGAARMGNMRAVEGVEARV